MSLYDSLQMSSTFHSKDVIDASTARDHFQGRELTVHQQPARFDGTTTSRDTYVPHPLQAPLPYQMPAAHAPTPFEGHTTYADTYHPHPLEARRLPPPQHVTRREGEFDGTTTYASQFPGHMPAPRNPPSPVPTRENVKFDATTSYAADYYAKAAPHSPTHAPQYVPRPNVPLDSTTSYADSYRPHALPPRLPYGAPPQPVHHPFEGQTTHQTTYVPYHISPRVPGGPAAYKPVSVPFDGTTTYGDNFHPHPIEHRLPVPQLEPRPPTHFEGTSTYKDQFVPKELERRPQHAPAYSPRPDMPLDASTTYGDTFTKHTLPERLHYEAPPLRASEPFDATTTHASTFVRHELMPRASHSPPRAEHRHVPFDGTTTMQDAFKSWQLEPRTAAPPPPLRPQVPFEGSTTSGDTFRGWQLPPKTAAIGVEVFGDRMHTLIPRGASLPYVGRHVFTTAHDGQEEICILILRGDSPVASQNELLGQFDLTKIPYARARSPHIEVTFTLSEASVLSVTARDLDTQRHYAWLEDGRMLVRTISDQVREVGLRDSHDVESNHGDWAGCQYQDQAGQMTVYPPAHAGMAAA